MHDCRGCGMILGGRSRTRKRPGTLDRCPASFSSGDPLSRSVGPPGGGGAAGGAQEEGNMDRKTDAFCITFQHDRCPSSVTCRVPRFSCVTVP